MEDLHLLAQIVIFAYLIVNHTDMKTLYLQPESCEVRLMPRDGLLLSGSNEGYSFNPFDPGLNSSPFDDGLSALGGDDLLF